MVTYRGMLKTKNDALLLIQATNVGVLQRLKSRLSEYEKSSISSGDVFVLSEQESNVKRWTDGFNWSASRMQGDFLIYKRITNGYVENMFKKVLSIQIDQHKFHVVSYYNPESYLNSPTEDQELKRKMYLAESNGHGSAVSEYETQEREPEEFVPFKKQSLQTNNFSPSDFITVDRKDSVQQSASPFSMASDSSLLPFDKVLPELNENTNYVRYKLDHKHLTLLNNFFY